jgi:hypothetical protein
MVSAAPFKTYGFSDEFETILFDTVVLLLASGCIEMQRISSSTLPISAKAKPRVSMPGPSR